MVGGVAGKVAQRGVAIINLLGLLFLTPVVTFYLLRDWPKVLAAIDGALPLDHADTIRQLARESNAAVAGYVRGQALVCLCLGTIYGVGLSLGRAAVRLRDRPDRRPDLLHPLRRHAGRRDAGDRHGAGAVPAGLDRRRQGGGRCS